MPKQRIQADVGFQHQALRPSSQVVDTFVRPSGAGSQAEQVAAALSKLVPELSRFAGALAEKQSAADLRKGAQKARETVTQLDESRQTFAEAVRNGQVPAHLNPWMKQGYYEELGRTYAGRLQADLTSAIETDENLKNTVEMGDFRKFTADFETKWLESNVPKQYRNDAFTVGYGNRRDAILANLEAGWSAQTEQRFTQRTLAMFRDEAVGFVQDALDKEFTHAEIGDFLKLMLDDKHALGWNARQTGATLIDALSDVAVERKDAGLMEDLLKAIPRGPGEPPKSYALQKLEETRTAVFQAKGREYERNERERTLELRGLMSDAASRFQDAVAKGLDKDEVNITDLQAKAIALGAANVSEDLQTMKDAYRNREFTDDAETVADFLEKLHRSPTALTQAALNTALRQKHLSLQTFQNLSNARETQERESASGQGKAFLENDPWHEFGEKTVKGYFSQSPEADTPEVARLRQQALRQFSKWYYDEFVVPGSPGSKLSPWEKRQKIEEQADALSKVWVPFSEQSSGTAFLSGEDFNWKSRAVLVPDRLNPMLDELAGLLRSKGGRPSPQLISLLKIYQVNLKSRDDLIEFLTTQRKFANQIQPPRKPKPDGTGTGK